MITADKGLFFIINKYSGSGFSATMEQQVRDACKTHSVPCHIEYTQYRGHATELARIASNDQFDKIIAVGGDGTVNEVAQAMVHQKAAMGIIPKGSGNGLARHLGISMRFTDALSCLFSSKTVAIDTLRVNGMLSLNVSGVGFDGYVAERFGVDKRRGFEGYTRLVLNEFRTFREFAGEIEADGTRKAFSAFVVAMANSAQYGNNATIAPGASVCDGLLNLTVLKKFPVYRVDFIYALFAGTLERSSFCETLQFRNATIRLEQPMPYHVDGEFAGMSKELNVLIDPLSLSMIAPCEKKF